MNTPAREAQSEQDRAEIKIKLIENGIIVKGGEGWFSFPAWEGQGGASEHVGKRIEALKAARAGKKP